MWNEIWERLASLTGGWLQQTKIVGVGEISLVSPGPVQGYSVHDDVYLIIIFNLIYYIVLEQTVFFCNCHLVKHYSLTQSS